MKIKRKNKRYATPKANTSSPSNLSGVSFIHSDGKRSDVAIALAKAIEKNAEAIISVTKLGAPASLLSVSDTTGLVVSDCSFVSGEETVGYQSD